MVRTGAWGPPEYNIVRLQSSGVRDINQGSRIFTFQVAKWHVTVASEQSQVLNPGRQVQIPCDQTSSNKCLPAQGRQLHVRRLRLHGKNWILLQDRNVMAQTVFLLRLDDKNGGSTFVTSKLSDHITHLKVSFPPRHDLRGLEMDLILVLKCVQRLIA